MTGHFGELDLESCPRLVIGQVAVGHSQKKMKQHCLEMVVRVHPKDKADALVRSGWSSYTGPLTADDMAIVSFSATTRRRRGQ